MDERFIVPFSILTGFEMQWVTTINNQWHGENPEIPKSKA
jgi:hypothetical protein